LSIYLEPSLWLHQIFISKTVCHHFSPGLLEGMGCTLYGRIYNLALSLLPVQSSNQQHLSQGWGLTGIAPYGEPWTRKKVPGPMTRCCAGQTPDGPLPICFTCWWHRLVRLGLRCGWKGKKK
jgi:hypothetical protein